MPYGFPLAHDLCAARNKNLISSMALLCSFSYKISPVVVGGGGGDGDGCGGGSAFFCMPCRHTLDIPCSPVS